MSLRNRARSLQKKTGLTYQQALARLRALGDRPATLRRQTHWRLEVCDRYLVDGHAPIDVEEVDDAPFEYRESDSVRDRIRAVCEALRSMLAARAVAVVDQRGHVLVRVGDAGDDGKRLRVRPLKWRRSVGYAKLCVWFPSKRRPSSLCGGARRRRPRRSSACSTTTSRR